MVIEIRPIETEDEYRAVEQLQREIWGAQDIEIVAHEMLMTAHKNGGVMLGAFDREKLIGFVFGFVGLTPEGRIKHCSHMAGVAADYRDQNVGYALKLKQREQALAQGIELVTWTFDPLESRNARFNFHKLSGVCNTYLRNFYGAMRDALNAGLPSDRFQVDWRIASSRVESRLRGAFTGASPANLLAGGVPLINPPVTGRFLRPPEKVSPFEEARALIQIPSDFQSLKAADRELALAWRLHTRGLFEGAFAQGYLATDLLVENGQAFYHLERNSSV